MHIIKDRFEVGYIDGQAGSFPSLNEAMITAREFKNRPGLAVIDHLAGPGRTQMWAVVDGKIRGISRKD